MKLLLPLFILSYSSVSSAQNDISSAQNEIGYLDSNENVTTIRIDDDYGVHNVSYFVDDGLAIVEDDVIYGTEAQLLAKRVQPEIPLLLAKRAISVFPNGVNSQRTWPGGIIPYRYGSFHIKNLYQTKVESAISVWTKLVPCISFEPDEDNKVKDDPTPDILTIRAAKKPGCRSSVGQEAGVDAILQLDPNTTKPCDLAAVIHELGHALGLKHEQHRHDAGPFICENLEDYDPSKPKCCDYGSCCGKACNFVKFPFGEYYTTENAPRPGYLYDLDSVMHYRRRARGRKDASGIRMITLPLAREVAATVPSAGDEARLRDLYGCLSTCPKTCKPHNNICHQPTAQTCVPTLPGTPNTYCACRPGFKAGQYDDGDTTKQWRLPISGHEDQVWVAEDVKCNHLCDGAPGTPGCREVSVIDKGCL
ncbi:MAG: hypothetical protein M1833_005755 [Piccolia ochrophora]|nr:MAG: hypothetical protein M1833_005755 [Piccolia ochrophora]